MKNSQKFSLVLLLATQLLFIMSHTHNSTEHDDEHSYKENTTKNYTPESDENRFKRMTTVLTDHIYSSVVGMNKEVWVIKIASKQCSGCIEFHPEFMKLVNTFEHVKYGIVYIEDEDGMVLAKKFKGVLDKGLPAVILISQQDQFKFKHLVAGTVVKTNQLKKLLIPELKNLKYSLGYYLRKAGKYKDHGHEDL